MMTHEHIGRAAIATWGKVLVVMLALVSVALIALGITHGDGVALVLGLVLLAVDAAMMALCHVDTYVGSHEVVVKMPPFPTRAYKFRDITSAEATSQGSGFRGLGYRWLGKDKIGYLSGGPEVRLVLRDGSQFIFSCPDARALVTRIDSARHPR